MVSGSWVPFCGQVACWQAKADKGFDVAHFQLDWQSQQATCPQGQQSSRWSRAGERIEVVFAQEVCAGCPVRSDCTRSQTVFNTVEGTHLIPKKGPAFHLSMNQ